MGSPSGNRWFALIVAASRGPYARAATAHTSVREASHARTVDGRPSRERGRRLAEGRPVRVRGPRRPGSGRNGANRPQALSSASDGDEPASGGLGGPGRGAAVSRRDGRDRTGRSGGRAP